MKEVTREEAKNILTEIGHHANVTVPVKVKEEYEDTEGKWVTHEQETVLNDAIVSNPYHGQQIGMSSNKNNAENAMKFIKNEFTVYSSVFSSYSGQYKIIE